MLRGTAPIKGENIPTLVTFSDLNDPKSARVVAPEEFGDVFGPGYEFKRAWIEMTDDPVSTGIEKKIPLIVTYRKKLWKHVTYPGQYNASLSHFKRD